MKHNPNLNSVPARTAAFITEKRLNDSSETSIGGDRQARLETAEGKPVIISEFDHPEHGKRISVSLGSVGGEDLQTDMTVSLEEVPGGNLPAIHPVTREDAFQIIKDLHRAK